MSTVIKLVVTALILNACVQGGRSAWGFYQFQDSVQQAVLFSTRESPDQLRARIAAIAQEQGIELDADTLSVSYLATQARIKAEYVDDVRLLPGGPPYNWTHVLDLDMRRMAY
ncbi:MAG: hypothetical protein R2708_00620 [Vicinamibacterales bacterium]